MSRKTNESRPYGLTVWASSSSPDKQAASGRNRGNGQTWPGRPIDEDVDISGVKKLLQASSTALRKRGINPHAAKFLGQGSQGIAMAVGGGKVLKITEDSSEARAMARLKGHSLKHLVKVYDVFRFPMEDSFSREDNEFRFQELYGILQEELIPLSHVEGKIVMSGLSAIAQVLGNQGRNLLRGKTWSQFEREVREKSPADAEERLSLAKAFSLDEMLDELHMARIKFSDFHTGNIMTREDGTFVLIDLGYSEAPETTIDDLTEKLMRALREAPVPPPIPANPDKLRTTKGALPSDSYEKFAQVLRNKKGINNVRRLGSGTQGIAYEILDGLHRGKVLKITKDPKEAVASFKLMNKDLKHVVHVYDVFKFKDVDIYGIIEEKLKPLSDADMKRFNVCMSLNGMLGKDSFLPAALRRTGSNWSETKALMRAQAISNWEEKFGLGPEDRHYKQWVRSFDGMLDELENHYGVGKILDELNGQGIRFNDFQGANMMVRGTDYVLVDVGYSRTEGGRFPPVLEKAVTDVMLGLTEGVVDRVGLTIGRYQPFHSGHAKVIRELAKSHTKVIVFVAGLKRDEDNPFSYDLRVDLMKASLPDVASKLEVYRAEAKGKQTGYLPDLVEDLFENHKSSIKPDTAVEVCVGADRAAGFEKQLRSTKKVEGRLFDPSLYIVKKVERADDEASGTQARELLRKGDRKGLEKLMDPHVLSDRTAWDGLYERMRKELLGTNESLLREFMVDVGGKEAVERVIQDNAELLLSSKGIDMSEAEELGAGRNGIAYKLPSGRVLKVTTDRHEVESAARVRGLSLDHIYRVYDVFRFPDQDQIWGIVQEEGLEKLSSGDAQEFDDLMSRLSAGEAEIEELERFQLDLIIADLMSAGIDFDDFHSGNLMRRGDDLVLIDLGTAGDPPDRSVNEALKDIGGDAGVKQILQQNADVLKSKKQIDVSALKELGQGQMGVAFEIAGKGRVLKVTSDQREAIAATAVMNKGTTHVYHVFDTFRFKDTPGTNQPVYGIVQERLEDLSPQEREEIDNVIEPLRGSAEFDGKSALDYLAVGDIEGVLKHMRKELELEVRQDLQYPEGSEPNPRKEKQLRQVVERRYETIAQGVNKFQIVAMAKELKSMGIQFADYKSDNIRKRGSDYVIIDIGASKGPSREPPTLESLVSGVIGRLLGEVGGIPQGPTDMAAPRANYQSSQWSSGQTIIEPKDEDEDGRSADQVRDRLQKM